MTFGKTFFFCFLSIVLGAFAYHPDPVLKRYATEGFNTLIDPLVSLEISTTVLPSSGSTINVSWSGVSSPSTDDFVAAFAPALVIETSPNTSSPIKFQYAFISPTHLTDGAGTITFELLNLRDDYAFGFFTGPLTSPTLIATSSSVSFVNPNEVLLIHLGFTGDSSEMRVNWVSKNGTNPTAQYYKDSNKEVMEVKGETSTYTRDDLCGGPATTIGYHNPGNLHSAIMTELEPGTIYRYRVGDSDLDVWSDWIVFKSAPETLQKSSDPLLRFSAFGDMGTAEPDGSKDSGHQMEIPAIRSTQLLQEALSSLNPIDLVVHIGDISYARGFDSQWDEFLSQIEPVAKQVPWMVNLGNHERDFPTGSKAQPSISFYNGTDSGGECGIPTERRFPMPYPALDGDSAWYSFNWGPVHFTLMSTEHDFQKGSEQYNWIEEDWKSVDRTVTPWVILGGHRPMYIDSTYGSDNPMSDSDLTVSLLLRESLEDLMMEYEVDLGIWGHHHSYQRTCHVYNSVCIAPSNAYSDSYNGPVHLVIGMAGQGLSTNTNTLRPAFTEYVNIAEYGIVFMEVNSTFLHTSWVLNVDGTVADEVILLK